MKLLYQGHTARKWWSKGLNPDKQTQECRCLEALERLIEGYSREGRGAEGWHCSPWEASEQLHPVQPCLLTLLSQTLTLSLGVLC